MAKVEETLDGHFIVISEKEAIETIKSLSTQLLNKSGNAGRVEYGNPYFTIAIEREEMCHTLDSEYAYLSNEPLNYIVCPVCRHRKYFY
jgi:hypothetical protein